MAQRAEKERNGVISMKVIKRDTELRVSQIYPHPDNPRRDVGDVTELADSIKANGLFQNLTVVYGGKGVPLDDQYEPIDGYTVIIGHRRLAAAKLAGLEYVPCMVAEMDECEQAATMLLENMQRSDLTVYEQAQGFQMMLDLGETQEGIAQKTGFSKSTIRHRLKLLELDPEELRRAQERQATFSDYIALEKIKDPANKTKALKAIGTSNFEFTVRQIIERENAGDNFEKASVFLDSKLKKIRFDNRFQYRQIGYTPMSKALTEERQREIDDLIAKGAKYYTVSSDSPEYAWAYIYADPKKEDDAEKQKRTEQENRRRARDAKITELERQTAALRKAFVKDFANRDYIGKVTEAFLTSYHLDDIDYDDVAEILGIELKDNESWDDLMKKPGYKKQVKQHPESVMLAMLLTTYEGAYRAAVHDFNGDYRRNDQLGEWYAILTRVGYRMSDDETKLLAGTHECFDKEV